MVGDGHVQPRESLLLLRLLCIVVGRGADSVLF